MRRKVVEPDAKPFRNIDSFQVKKIEALEVNAQRSQIKLACPGDNERKKCCSSLKDSLRASRVRSSLPKQKSKPKPKPKLKMFENENMEMRGWEVERVRSAMKEDDGW